MDITIVIPIYNREQYIGNTLESIAKSSVMPKSIILVDNNCTDGSMDICNRFKAEHETDDLSIVVTEEKKTGANAARNNGLKLCKTEWVYFFDSDDIFDSSFIQSMDRINKECDCICFPTVMNVDGKQRVRKFRNSPDVPFQILTGMLSTQSMLFRTDFLKKIGGWNESIQVWQDWELGTRLLLSYPIIHWVPKPFHNILVHGDSITGNKLSDRYSERIHTMKTVCAQLKGNKQRKALILRSYILLGMFRREENHDAVNACMAYIKKNFANKYGTVGKVISNYVAMGGHGAWRIAYLLG